MITFSTVAFYDHFFHPNTFLVNRSHICTGESKEGGGSVGSNPSKSIRFQYLLEKNYWNKVRALNFLILVYFYIFQSYLGKNQVLSIFRLFYEILLPMWYIVKIKHFIFSFKFHRHNQKGCKNHPWPPL